MPEVILVLLERPETAPGLLRAAERLSLLADGAHIDALAVEGAAQSALEAAFADWSAAAPLPPGKARWHAVADDLRGGIEERGRRADLIVVARPAEDDGRAVRQAFRTALLRTGRPVLVVPPGQPPVPDFGHCVVIAWREDEHTVKSVVPALRYVARAEQVILLAGVREGRPVPAVPEVFAERGVAAELHLMPIGAGRLGASLLARAHALGADLLIMGAYAHSPLHNLVYGGMTRFMLDHADLPVLMRY
jgi:nucleotide-binding universal stress UspA family protein